MAPGNAGIFSWHPVSYDNAPERGSYILFSIYAAPPARKPRKAAPAIILHCCEKNLPELDHNAGNGYGESAVTLMSLDRF